MSPIPLSPYALEFGHYNLFCFARDTSWWPVGSQPSDSSPLLCEPQLAWDSAELVLLAGEGGRWAALKGWARACSLLQADASWVLVWTTVVSKSLDGVFHFCPLYLDMYVWVAVPLLHIARCYHSSPMLSLWESMRGLWELATCHSHLFLPNLSG